MAECMIEGCDTDIILDFPILTLHGSLCDAQRDILMHLTGMQIVLHRSSCRELPNCRYVTKLFSKYINFKNIKIIYERKKSFLHKVFLVMILERVQQEQVKR